MASKAGSISTNPSGKGRKPMPVTAFLATHQLSAGEIAQVSRALEEKRIKGLRATKLLLGTPANHLRELDQEPVPASIVENDGPVGADIGPAGALAAALDAARARGAILKDEMLSDPDMLSTAGLAERLGMSEEGIRLKRRRHEVLGVEVANHSWTDGFRSTHSCRLLLPGGWPPMGMCRRMLATSGSKWLPTLRASGPRRTHKRFNLGFQLLDRGNGVARSLNNNSQVQGRGI